VYIVQLIITLLAFAGVRSLNSRPRRDQTTRDQDRTHGHLQTDLQVSRSTDLTSRDLQPWPCEWHCHRGRPRKKWMCTISGMTLYELEHVTWWSFHISSRTQHVGTHRSQRGQCQRYKGWH